LPDPTYRLRIDSGALPSASPSVKTPARTAKPPSAPAKPELADATDVAPDTSLAERVEEERREGKSGDLLSEDAPSE